MKRLLDIETGKVYYMESLERGDSEVPTQDVLDKLAEDITTLKNDRDELGDQVSGLQQDFSVMNKSMSAFETSAAFISGSQTLADKTLTNSTIKDRLNVVGDNSLGESFLVDFSKGTAQISANNDIDILSNMNFVLAPTIEEEQDFEKLADNKAVYKGQISQAISGAVGHHFDAAVLIGSPISAKINSTPKNLPISAYKSYPENSPKSFSINDTKDGIVFNVAGIIKVRMDVPIWGNTSADITVQIMKNGETNSDLDPFKQIIPAGASSFKVDFYCAIVPGDTLSVSLTSPTAIDLYFNYVSTLIEYL